MVPLRSALALIVSSALLGSACTGPTQEGRMVPESSHSVQNELGYTDVVKLSQDYALTSGYEVTEVAEAVQVRPNYWRIRFGLAPEGSGKMLDVDFDQTQGRVVGTTVVGSEAAGRGVR
jgi:hypothetical protein